MRNFIHNLPRTLCFMLAAALTIQTQAAEVCSKPDNLLKNGSFEKGVFSPNSLPDNWSWDAYNYVAMPSWDDHTAQAGNKSVRIDSLALDDSRWIQSIPTRPKTLYNLSGWIKTEDVNRSPEFIDAGANLSLLNTFTRSPGLLGTQDWTRTGVLFNSQDQNQVTVAARLGFYSGTTTGTAWFDDLKLSQVLPSNPHPRWNILVLIYRGTDFTYTDSSGTQRHVVATMADDEVEQAANAARQFVEKDIPALTSTNMLPRLTIRYPEEPLTELSRHGEGWWPSPENTAPSRDPAFDSVIVIWDPRTIDQNTGQSIWIGSAAGLALAMGTGQAYATIIVEAATSYGHRNVFKHEWGHSILHFFDAAGTAPPVKVENHAAATQYVNCLTGNYYVWEDETDANPIPNSIYNNESGFTHDYYSGITARAEEPGRCLGITPEAWAFGGPVSNSANHPVFSALSRVVATVDHVQALVTSDQLDARHGETLQRTLKIAGLAAAKNQDRIAKLKFELFKSQTQWLVTNKQLLPHAGELLIAAARSTVACL